MLPTQGHTRHPEHFRKLNYWYSLNFYMTFTNYSESFTTTQRSPTQQVEYATLRRAMDTPASIQGYIICDAFLALHTPFVIGAGISAAAIDKHFPNID